MPWKNGAGITTELARAGSTESYDWRLSIADITTDGPFSSFPDCRRIITVLEGAGMQLTVDGQSSGVLRQFTAFAFDGDSETNCALIDGPVRDFNLIYRTSHVGSRFVWVELSVLHRFVTAAPTVLIFAVGQMTLQPSGSRKLRLRDQETVQIGNDSGATLTITLEGGQGKRAAIVEIWPL
jgi:environmental stress-induced protein Ves